MKNAKKEPELPFGSSEFKEAWDEWIQFRTESRFKKYVPTGLKKTFAKLLRDSNNDEPTAIAILDQSIANNWQGLFPLKNTYNVQSSNTNKSGNRHETGITSAIADFKKLANERGIPDMPDAV